MKNNLFIQCLFISCFLVLAMGCQKDECTQLSWYEDADGDGLGDPDVSIEECEKPEGYVDNDSDFTPHSILNIGDTYEGGLIFYVDATGEHGKVCSITDLGGQYYSWLNAIAVCDLYEGGGYTDWYLPLKDELNEMYLNLHVNSIGGFSNDLYWSSTEVIGDNDRAWHQRFDNGNQGPYWKYTSTLYARAVRVF